MSFKHTYETLKEKLNKNEFAVARAMVALYNAGVLENSLIGQSLARQILIYQSEVAPSFLQPLSPNQVKAARYIISDHINLLLTITEEKE